MDYRESLPPTDLRPWIRRFWSLASNGGDASAGPSADQPVERVVPDGRMEIVVHLGDAFSEWRPGASGGELRPQPRALLAGQLAAPLFLVPGRSIDLFAIRFEPWGVASLLGIEAEELSGRIVALDQVLGSAADQLVYALCQARDAAARVAAAADWCRARRGAALSPPMALVRAVRLAQSGVGSARVESLTAAAGTTARQLERTFLRHVGLAPKTFLRVARLQRVVAALAADDERPLARLALAAGYCDQSHLTRDFLELAGTTPGRFRREQRGLETLLVDPAPARA
ncbi:MAG: AraC family transcriptional regulator [Planctomycetota bacterium]